MTTSSGEPAHHVHMVGTVPTTDAESAFRMVGGTLGNRLRRITDGETGPRNYWITSQARVLHFSDEFEPAGHDWHPDSGTVPEKVAPKYRLKAGVDPKTLVVPSFGYARLARESHALFRRLKDEGVIAPDVRFQVSLPTPIAFLAGIVAPESHEDVAEALEENMRKEVADIVASIPHEDLAIQWDACLEIFIWEGLRSLFYDDDKTECLVRLSRMIDLVPQTVPVGYHLCYGDFRHKHGVEPKDMGVMVTMANFVTDHVHRPIDFVHMPVPRDRDDDAYFEPLKDLRLHEGTELFLGLVHYTDGEEGTLRRMNVAARHWPDFGIGTECGLGRRDPSTIEELLRIHARCADAETPGDARTAGTAAGA
ncbi:hypothetical protein [Microbaculum marinum]|uniref:Uncharacterized protein n=1 Tax=Microbaculum marinum TaxID=1764581 RepID=A0AAW9RT55_9HYPH